MLVVWVVLVVTVHLVELCTLEDLLDRETVIFKSRKQLVEQ
jgi:hypothetical protein